MNILVVEDTEEEFLLIQKVLHDSGYNSIIHAPDARRALKRLEQSVSPEGVSNIELIIMDVQMPEIDGIQACRRIKSMDTFKDIPVIVVTAHDSEEKLEAAFNAGAMDYITRPYNRVEFLVRIKSALRLKQEISLRIAREKELKELNKILSMANQFFLNDAITDKLTGLYNRRHFDVLLARAWWDSLRKRNSFSLMLIDIDHFKAFNDTYGHQLGDEVLTEVARVISQSITEPEHALCRYGGEEFVALLPGASQNEARDIAEDMRAKVEQRGIEHRKAKGRQMITISLGLATVIPENDDSSERLLRIADQALYQAKESGRNQICLAEIQE